MSLALIRAGSSAAKSPVAPAAGWAGSVTVLRASVATATDDSGVVHNFAVNEARLVNDWIVSGHAENVAHPYDGPYASSGCTITNDDTAAPDGQVTADKIAITANLGVVNWLIASLAVGVKYTTTLYAKFVGGSPLWQLGWSGYGGPTNISLTAPWVRYVMTQTTAGVSTNARFIETGATDDGVAHFWGSQTERRDYPTEVVPTNLVPASSSPDDILWPTLLQPSWIRTKWTTRLKLHRASTETPDASTETLLAYATGTSDRIYITGNQITVVVGGVVKIQTTALTWSRLQTIDLTFDLAGGEITVAGATTGNGVHTGVAASMPAGNIYVLNDNLLGTTTHGYLEYPAEAA